MPIVQGDPTFIANKEKHFIDIAKQIATASTHPMSPGGCVIVRGRDIVGDGRSLLASCKIEIDCVTYAIGAAAKRGTPMSGSVVYSTRYPFSASVFQMHLMGINKVVVLSHDWEPYYKDEFRRSAKLARELGISIEPYFEDADERFATNASDDREEFFENRDLYTHSPAEEPDDDDPAL